MKMRQRDDAVPFTSRWVRGDKRYQLCLGFALTEPPRANLPAGVSWDLWYEKSYVLLQMAVLSGVKRWGGLLSHKTPHPILECLVPVRSQDGKPGWYRFFQNGSGMEYRVQFFPEAKSSRSEIEFRRLWGKEFSVMAATHGGAMANESTPEAGYCFTRGFVLEPKGNGIKLSTFEHQNRMAWEAEELVVTLPEKWWPDALRLADTKPEFAYFAKGSPFASSLPLSLRA